MDQFVEFAAIERSGWNNPAIVEAYVDRFAPITDEVALTLSEFVGRPDKNILDLCCGQGHLTRLLSETGAEVTGIDFSPAMLEVARKTATRAEFVEGDAADMPFLENCFDAVVCNFGLMHLPDRQAALAEVSRVLRPKGQFVMATWIGPEASPAFGTVYGAVKAHANFSQAPKQPDLFGIADPEVAGKMFENVGLRLTRRTVLEPAWVMPDPSDLFEIFLTATVGARMLIRSQSDDIVQAIRDQITKTVFERFQNGEGYRVPAPVAVIVAEKQ